MCCLHAFYASPGHPPTPPPCPPCRRPVRAAVLLLPRRPVPGGLRCVACRRQASKSAGRSPVNATGGVGCGTESKFACGTWAWTALPFSPLARQSPLSAPPPCFILQPACDHACFQPFYLLHAPLSYLYISVFTKLPSCVQVRRCSSCRVASYCSRDCQMRHWRAAHRWQCASLAALRNAAQQGGRAARAQAAAGPAVGGGGGEGDGRVD